MRQTRGMTQRREQRWVKWRGLVSEQEQSRQSVAAFCGARGLSRSYFYHWKRRLQEASGPQFVEVQVVKANPDGKPSGAALGSKIEVRLSNGRSLVVGPEFDASHLRALLGVVES